MLDEIYLSPGSVASVLIDLNTSAAGPDGLHPHLLRACSAALSLPLYILFERSLQEGVLPILWKNSIVAPLNKNGSRCDPLNYRPVSLTSVCCKVLERVIVSQLMDYLELNGLLSLHQFVFCKGVEDQLLVIYGEVVELVDKGFAVDMIFLDFAKALDVVNHSIILVKLQMLGIGGRLLLWICEFLSGRSMSVNTFPAKGPTGGSH